MIGNPGSVRNVLFLLGILWPSLSGWAQAQSYAITDLGTLGGNASQACALNDRGQVVGLSMTAQSPYDTGFLWENGLMLDLGLLETGGINTQGQVTGTDERGHAVLWVQGVKTDLGTLGGRFSYAQALNDAGQVVGYSYLNDNFTRHAFLWANGVMVDLGTLGSRVSYGEAVNAAGQVVGYSYTDRGRGPHAFLWESGQMRDLGTLGGRESQAYGINDSGQVVGYAQIAGAVFLHAFLWEKGHMQDLGTLGGAFSFAWSINSRGQVVGHATTAAGADHPFLWDRGTMTDLERQIPAGSGWESLFARAVNDAGQIIGYGQHHRQLRAFLMTPPPVP
jgi:probable HAF family extracellular repeat protein